MRMASIHFLQIAPLACAHALHCTADWCVCELPERAGVLDG